MAYPHDNGAFPPKLGESQEHVTATLRSPNDIMAHVRLGVASLASANGS